MIPLGTFLGATTAVLVLIVELLNAGSATNVANASFKPFDDCVQTEETQTLAANTGNDLDAFVISLLTESIDLMIQQASESLQPE